MKITHAMERTGAFLRAFHVGAGLILMACRLWAAPIHDAATAGDVAAVRAQLAANAVLLEARNASSFTPLMVAVEKGHVEVVRLLLERGADIRARMS